MRKFLYLFAIIFLYCGLAHSQNLSVKESKEKFHKNLNNLIGKDFWIKSNPNAKSKKIFKNEARTLVINYNEFEIDRDQKFTVIGWEFNFSWQEHLKVQFSDNKIAYIDVSHLIHGNKMLDDIFNGYEYDDSIEYFFEEDPSIVLPRQMEEIKKWKLKIAKEVENENRLKKLAIEKEKAAYKAKGGVSIGMTKERVLRSNWGKPNRINRTTNAYGVTEQWVYGGGNYLYFSNGILTTIQN